jgi:hypothetical protein
LNSESNPGWTPVATLRHNHIPFLATVRALPSQRPHGPVR